MLKHLRQGLEDEFEVVFAKARLLGQEGRDKAVGHVHAVGHGVFAAHGAVIAVFGLIFSLVTAMRVMECSSATMGSTERAKVSRTGPRTWPQLVPVDMTAPNVRTSKKFWHIHWRAWLTSSALRLRSSLAGFLFLASVAMFSVASCACSSGAASRFNAE